MSLVYVTGPFVLEQDRIDEIHDRFSWNCIERFFDHVIGMEGDIFVDVGQSCLVEWGGVTVGLVI